MTRDELRDVAAQLLGFPSYDSSGPEKSWISRAVTRAVYRCFQPVEGNRMRWAEEGFGLHLPAPITLTLGVTNNSRDFSYTASPPSLPDASIFRGSYVLIGQEFYTYAESSENGEAGKFVEPYAGATGVVSAQFFHNSVMLDDRIFSVMRSPELLGYGRLNEIAGKPQEAIFRSVVYNDYWPLHGVYFYNTSAVQYGANSRFLMGTPAFYFVDDTMVGGLFGRRFVVHPLPEEAHSVRLRGSVGPSIPPTGQVPFPGPSDFAEVCLIPVLEKICSSSKRYAGKNQRELSEEYAAAIRMLLSFSKAQNRRPTRTRLKPGY